MADGSRPVVYTTLFARDADSPYIAMAMLNVISLRRHNRVIPYVLFDYSRNQEVAARMASWQKALGFEIRPLLHEALLLRFEFRHAWGMRYDALLHVPDTDPAGNVFIHVDADTLCLRDPAELAYGEFAYRLPRNPFEAFKISDWLGVFDLRKAATRRVLALARALNQEPHVWRAFDAQSSRRLSYPTSESCIEVAMQILGHEGFQPLDWSIASQYQFHYARHERDRHETMLAAAETLLDREGLRRRFEEDFGALRPLIFREGTDESVRSGPPTLPGAAAEVYVDDAGALRPRRHAEPRGGENWNRTAQLLWRLADGAGRVREIAAALSEALSAPLEAVRRDAEEFYLDLWRRGLVRFAARASRGASAIPREPGYPVLVAILGLHSSGSSCLAGVLQALGVYLGTDLSGLWGFEPRGFARICSQAYTGPERRRSQPPGIVVREFSRFLESLRIAAPGRHLGVKHPLTIALVPELEAAYPGPIRYVHIDRPLDHSIASLVRREQAWVPGLDRTLPRNHQLALWEMKQVVLAGRPNLTIDYYDLMARPRENIERLIDYLALTPDPLQIAEAESRIHSPASGRNID